MVAFVAPAAHTKSEQAGSPVAGGGLGVPSEWQNFTINDASNRMEGAIRTELLSVPVPKPERQLYREPEGEGGEYDFYLHGRKRAKLHDSAPCPVSQVSMDGVVFVERLLCGNAICSWNAGDVDVGAVG